MGEEIRLSVVQHSVVRSGAVVGEASVVALTRSCVEETWCWSAVPERIEQGKELHRTLKSCRGRW